MKTFKLMFAVGLGPAVQENAFGDILGSQGFAPSRLKEPTSLNAIRGKNEDDVSESDPDKLKVFPRL